MNTSRGPLRLPPRRSGGRGIIAILLTGLLLPLTANAQQRYFNLDFETATRGRLHSWYTGSTGYEYSPDTTVRMSGDQSLRISWAGRNAYNMILWMREFNLSGKGRMRFTGFDMQYMLVAAGIVRDFVKEADPDYLPTVDAAHALAIEVYNLKRSGSPDFAAKYDAAAEAVTAVREHLESLRSFDSGLRKDPVQRRPSQHITLDWAIQNSRIVEQATLLLADKTGLYRDEQMAANIDWILGQAPPGAKIVLWAHDYHVSRTEGAMGSFGDRRHNLEIPQKPISSNPE